MFVFNVYHTNYKDLLKDIASTIGVPYNNEDQLHITGNAGEGTISVLTLFGKLQVMLIKATFKESIKTIRQQSNTCYFTLHFDDAFVTETVKFNVDNEQLKKTNTRHSFARLTCNLFNNWEELSPNVSFRSIKILFNEEWLKKYMGLEANDNVLQKYLSLKTESFDMEKLDAEYLHLMDEMWQGDKDNPLQQTLFLQNRITLLMERFFTRLYNKTELLEGKFKLTDDEVKRLIKVEQLLVNDFSEVPPTIDEFSKMISMSSTKLKKSFKEMYGDSLYSYYQKLRMQKAKELLTSKKYNVREVADAIGYDNTSNFILAFKKQFNISPGDVAAEF